MVDPNMEIIYGWANEMGPAPAVPNSLKEPSKVAMFVNLADTDIFGNLEFWKYGMSEKQRFLSDVGKKAKTHISDIGDDGKRTNLTLRLWASCMSAAKALRETYVAGVNPDGSMHEEPYTSKMRKEIFQELDSLARRDEIYRIGIEAAPLLMKEVRRQEIFLEGVPSDSFVMKYVPKDKNP
jgi:hypothetical protein